MFFYWGSVKLKLRRVELLMEPSQSYRVSLAIWDHTVLPSTGHKWTCGHCLNPSQKTVLNLSTSEGWKAEWT